MDDGLIVMMGEGELRELRGVVGGIVLEFEGEVEVKFGGE